MSVIIEYSSNNSGGGWWLDDEAWRKLEAEGWSVKWFKDSELHKEYGLKSGRWLGALASSATKSFMSVDDAIKEWSRITDENPDDGGCDCCGPPHNFFERTDD